MARLQMVENKILMHLRYLVGWLCSGRNASRHTSPQSATGCSSVPLGMPCKSSSFTAALVLSGRTAMYRLTTGSIARVANKGDRGVQISRNLAFPRPRASHKHASAKSMFGGQTVQGAEKDLLKF